MKVVFTHPNRNVVIRTPSDKQLIHLVNNISSKNWKAAANGVFAHPSLREELPSVLQRAVSAEFKDYSRSDSVFCVLKGIEPDQLARFSSKLVLDEIGIMCPLWNANIQGACGNLSINSVVLCSCTS